MRRRVTTVTPHADFVIADAAIQPVRRPFAPSLVHLRLARVDDGACHHLAGIFQVAVHLLRSQQHKLSGVVKVVRFLGIVG